MSILFLDVDGVLNNSKHLVENRLLLSRSEEHFDKKNVAVLAKIVEIAKPKIVISSTWRKMHTLSEIRGFLISAGMTRPVNVVDKTPNYVGVGCKRGDEIQYWLDEHQKEEPFCILDDDDDMLHLLPFLVQTSFETGLTEEHIPAVLKLLGS